MFFNIVYDVFEYKVCGNVPQRYVPISDKNVKQTLHFIQVAALGKTRSYSRIELLHSAFRGAF